MPDKEKEGSGLPIGGVFVVLAILLGYFIAPDQPFKPSRQAMPDTAKSQVQESGLVDARLWEDPLKPSGGPRTIKPKRLTSTASPFWPVEWPRKFPRIRTDRL